MDKLRGYINIAIKAGKVVFGADNISDWTKKMYGIVLCETCSTNTAKKMREQASRREIPITTTSLEFLTNTKVIAITNKELYTIIHRLTEAMEVNCKQRSQQVENLTTSKR